MQSYAIDIILVNWNAGAQLRKAIQPLLQSAAYPMLQLHTWVVDNASSDQSLQGIEQWPVQLIQNSSNVGFGKACNMAYARGNSEYVLLLNPDVEWEIDTLQHLVAAMAAQPFMAAIGPQQRGHQQVVMRTCGRFPSVYTATLDTIGISKLWPTLFAPAPIMTDWNHLNAQYVDHVMGSFMLLRRQALGNQPLFDERFFLYHEDLDLSKRLHDAGYRSFFDTSVTVFHPGGGTSNSIRARRLFYSLQSRQQYWKKYFSQAGYAWLMLCAIALEPLARVTQAILKGSIKQAAEVLKAYRLWLLGK